MRNRYGAMLYITKGAAREQKVPETLFLVQLPRFNGLLAIAVTSLSVARSHGRSWGKRETLTCLLQESGRLLVLLPLWLVAKDGELPQVVLRLN
jgi:hypothetical protein